MVGNNSSADNENDNDKTGWTAIIKAVKTPLGFFTLVILILDGILGSAVLTENIPWWAPTLILVLIIVLVFIAMMIDPRILTPSSERIPSCVPLTFLSNGQRIASNDVDLNEEECKIWVRSRDGKPRHKGQAILVCRNGQWALRVPKHTKPSDDVRLLLIDENNQQWKVKSTPLNEINIEAVRIVGG